MCTSYPRKSFLGIVLCSPFSKAVAENPEFEDLRAADRPTGLSRRSYWEIVLNIPTLLQTQFENQQSTLSDSPSCRRSENPTLPLSVMAGHETSANGLCSQDKSRRGYWDIILGQSPPSSAWNSPVEQSSDTAPTSPSSGEFFVQTGQDKVPAKNTASALGQERGSQDSTLIQRNNHLFGGSIMHPYQRSPPPALPPFHAILNESNQVSQMPNSAYTGNGRRVDRDRNWDQGRHSPLDTHSDPVYVRELDPATAQFACVSRPAHAATITRTTMNDIQLCRPQPIRPINLASLLSSFSVSSDPYDGDSEYESSESDCADSPVASNSNWGPEQARPPVTLRRIRPSLPPGL